jgi:serine/threonine protein kinase/Flp pilus assembly protein TadD
MAVKCPKCNSDNPDDRIYCGKCATPLGSADEISLTKTIAVAREKLQIGSIFAERYEILDELGRGGMGVVYKAQDTKLRRTVALKFLPPELTHIPEFKGRFMQEAQAAAALDHPNICTVYEFDQADDKTFISMAFVEGQSLKKRIGSGPLELDEAIRIATQVAEGIQEAHSNEVIHRDIKSANIMLTIKNQPKIMDFGLARIAGGTQVTKEGMTMGTIAYMSPEQARGEDVDHRTDIWSLGVVLYEMIAGQLPFKGDRDQAVVYSILNEKPVPITSLRADIPESIEQIVSKSLEKNVDVRYQQIDELLDDLRSISEGVVPKSVGDRVKKERNRKINRAILYPSIAGFLILMIVITLSLFIGRSEAIDSIAVLPFDNLSNNPEQDYFSVGITDALINELAKISALRVISRTSVMQYKEVRKSLPEIARELDVDAVVEASIFSAGDKVQIRANLIQVPSEKNIWSQSYEREISDIMILQSEMAQTIAQEINVKLTAEEQALLQSARKVNPEAHDAYLNGRYFWNTRTKEGLFKGIEFFQQAIDIDPEFALAYVGLADSYGVMAAHGHMKPQEALPLGKQAVMKALLLDETLAEAYAIQAFLFSWYDKDWKMAEQVFKRSIELNPNYASAHQWYAELLAMTGRHDEAIAAAKRAQELDPLSPMISYDLGEKLYYAHRFDETIDHCLESLELFPNFPWTLNLMGWGYMELSRFDEAAAEFQKAYTMSGGNNFFLGNLGYCYGLSGQPEKAKDILDDLIELSRKEYVAPLVFAFLYMGLGQWEETFDYLNAAMEEMDYALLFAAVDAGYGPIREDPRFQDLLRRMNLLD